MEKRSSDWENSQECPLATTTLKVGENLAIRVAELISYDAKTWQRKVNIELMVRNFYQSYVLRSHCVVL